MSMMILMWLIYLLINIGVSWVFFCCCCGSCCKNENEIPSNQSRSAYISTCKCLRSSSQLASLTNRISTLNHVRKCCKSQNRSVEIREIQIYNHDVLVSLSHHYILSSLSDTLSPANARRIETRGKKSPAEMKMLFGSVDQFNLTFYVPC